MYNTIDQTPLYMPPRVAFSVFAFHLEKKRGGGGKRFLFKKNHCSNEI